MATFIQGPQRVDIKKGYALVVNMSKTLETTFEKCQLLEGKMACEDMLDYTFGSHSKC
jgi:hypothetical protein